MTVTAPKPPARPLSPHLQIYKLGLTGNMSIVHRVTGVGLTLALPLLVCWLVALSKGPVAYHIVMSYVATPLGKLLLMGFSWAFCYHLCTGIRHLIWDTGRALSIEQVYSTGRIALAVSTALTIILWLAIWGFSA